MNIVFGIQNAASYAVGKAEAGKDEESLENPDRPPFHKKS
jgi:hypothetical protein